MSNEPTRQRPLERIVRPLPALYGCDELRVWLGDRGFQIERDNLVNGAESMCNWIAWRKLKVFANECECNEKPPSFVVKPYEYMGWESVACEIVGELSGIWFRVKAYGMKPDELKKRMDEVEEILVNGWNALLRPNTGNKPPAESGSS